MGKGSAWRTSRSCSRLFGVTGSSYQAGSKRARRRPISTAERTDSRPCTSIINCTPGPTASRTAATTASAWSASAGVRCFQAWPKGSNFRPR